MTCIATSPAPAASFGELLTEAFAALHVWQRKLPLEGNFYSAHYEEAERWDRLCTAKVRLAEGLILIIDAAKQLGDPVPGPYRIHVIGDERYLYRDETPLTGPRRSEASLDLPEIAVIFGRPIPVAA